MHGFCHSKIANEKHCYKGALLRCISTLVEGEMLPEAKNLMMCSLSVFLSFRLYFILRTSVSCFFIDIPLK